MIHSKNQQVADYNELSNFSIVREAKVELPVIWEPEKTSKRPVVAKGHERAAVNAIPSLEENKYLKFSFPKVI